MYVPRLNAEHDVGVMHGFMEAHPFACLVSGGDGLVATHLPLLLRPDGGPFGTLEGHIARANQHHVHAAPEAESLVIFTGDDAHITPSWYASKAEHGKVVPTWNYVAVHAYGRVQFIEDTAWLHAHVSALTARHESGRASEWRVSDAPVEYVAQQLRAIVGVRMEITRLEGKWKMSQNRPGADIDGVVDGLRASGDAHDAHVAALIAHRKPK